jgi:hypothetical protein
LTPVKAFHGPAAQRLTHRKPAGVHCPYGRASLIEGMHMPETLQIELLQQSIYRFGPFSRHRSAGAADG